MNRKRILWLALVVMLCISLGWKAYLWIGAQQSPEMAAGPQEPPHRVIQDTVLQGETLLAIFAKHGLDTRELFAMRDAAAQVHPLRTVHPGRSYTLTVDEESRVQSFVYWINRDSFLTIRKTETDFAAEKSELAYERKIMSLSGVVEESLISSIGEDREHLLLALQLSDIFAWDIDFACDLRKGDAFRILVEGFYLEGEFRKYGNILAAEFTNKDEPFKAYRFENGDRHDYYDEEGNSRRKAFLKAPLNFRRISSHFAKSRLHPVLKITRPHHGIDYAAPAGTPVSAVGDGKVIFAGWSGGYGNFVIVRHPNGWKTCYGHLSKIARGVRKGAGVRQGQTIGSVGATGLATGPHLHYEVRINDKSVNPMKVKVPKGFPVPPTQLAVFHARRDQMDNHFSRMAVGVPSVTEPEIILAGQDETKRERRSLLKAFRKDRSL